MAAAFIMCLLLSMSMPTCACANMKHVGPMMYAGDPGVYGYKFCPELSCCKNYSNVMAESKIYLFGIRLSAVYTDTGTLP